MPTINKTRVRTQPAPSINERKERMAVYNTARWRRVRAIHLRRCPLCASCLRRGVVKQATDVHHLKSFMDVVSGARRDALAYDLDNLESLCKQCHQAEHHPKRSGQR